MLKHISYPDIDKAAYDSCVKASEHFRIYALSWYLDAVAEEWDVLVLDDYRAVMPLPGRRKWGMAYVYVPPFVQQLGVFSSAGLKEDQEAGFYRAASSRYALVDYAVHSGSRATYSGWKERTNYILALDRDYESLKKGFNKNRRRTLDKGFQDLRLDHRGGGHLFLSNVRKMTREEPGGFAPGPKLIRMLERLIDSGNEALHTRNVFHQNRWVGGLLWLSDPVRLTYLFPFLSREGREMQVGSFILDALIREHQETGLILDLEGSMIPGVAEFYRSFGAEKEIYYHFKTRLWGLLKA